MRRTLTAIGNSMLNQKIGKMENYKVLSEDIGSDEELLEALEREKNVEILFLYQNIIVHYSVDKLIELIRKMQENIFIILFNGEGVEETVKEDENLKLYHTMELDLNEFEKNLPQPKITSIQNYTSKIIAISGASGIGKSTFSTFLAKNVENPNSKILLIDFDLDENHIKTILKLKKNPQVKENVKDMIINVNKNLDVLYNLKIIFPDKENINFLSLQKFMMELKSEYPLILVDTSSNVENEYTKRIFYYSQKVIFLVEPNILGIKKARDMLEVIENDWKVSSEKINLVLNKTNMYEISENIIQELFPDMKIIGKMKYMDSYNLMINRDINKKEIKKEYEKIYKKI